MPFNSVIMLACTVLPLRDKAWQRVSRIFVEAGFTDSFGKIHWQNFGAVRSGKKGEFSPYIVPAICERGNQNSFRFEYLAQHNHESLEIRPLCLFRKTVVYLDHETVAFPAIPILENTQDEHFLIDASFKPLHETT